jgi:hypothetical protein
MEALFVVRLHVAQSVPVGVTVQTDGHRDQQRITDEAGDVFSEVAGLLVKPKGMGTR